MHSRFHLLAALALLLPAAASAQAQTSPVSGSASAFTLPVEDYNLAYAGGDDGRLEYGQSGGSSGRNDYIRYRPRTYRSRRSSYSMPVVSQVHGGFFDPNGSPSSGFMFGFRGGPMVDPHVQVGVSVDLVHKSSDFDEQFASGDIGGVGNVTATFPNEGTTTNFVPILGFIQFGGDDNMSVIPYVGVGGGYEILTLDNSGVEIDGASIDGTYGGWGWQIWAGAGMPLSGQARIFGEGFYNTAKVEQDIDGFSGPLRVKIDRDGLGARFGVSWGF